MSYTGFAVVEILGHTRHVGQVSEEEQFGIKGIRIRVPDGDKADGSFKSEHWYAGTSLFGLTPCTEEQARIANKTPSWEMEHRALPGVTVIQEGEDGALSVVDEDTDDEPPEERSQPIIGAIHGPRECDGPYRKCEHCVVDRELAKIGHPRDAAFTHCWELKHATTRADGDTTPNHEAEAAGLGVWWSCRHCQSWAEIHSDDREI